MWMFTNDNELEDVLFDNDFIYPNSDHEDDVFYYMEDEMMTTRQACLSSYQP